MNRLCSCRRLAQLLSQRFDERLGLIDSVRLRVHLSMCGNCAEVDKQLTGLKALAGKLFSGQPAP